MSDTRRQRRLAAILAADVAGFTAAMGSDEAGTLARLQALLVEILRPAVAEAGGRIFKEMGDGILAEFPSAVDAAHCAAVIQARAAAADALPLRVGLHLGDVIVEGDDLFGDGINLAARLQAEAAPGGIVTSAAFRQQVEGRARLCFRPLGEHRLKNVEAPVELFALGPEPNAEPAPGRARRLNIGTRRLVLAGLAAAAAIIFIAAWLLPNLVGRAPPFASGPPIIAVLPFENLSPDPEQVFFAEGLAEDLIIDLSKLGGLQVVSRTSSFAVDQRLPVAEIAGRLNAGFIVTGSVRRSGERLRITANLIDSAGDTPLWAERFDGARTDVFGFQDQITRQIVAALKVQLTPAEQRAVESRGTTNPAAYDAYLRGLRLLAARRRLDTEANSAAQAAFEEAIRLDPQYAQAYAGLAWTKWLYYETINYYGSPEAAFDLAKKSIALGDNALAHQTLARQYFSLLTYNISAAEIGSAVAELEAARTLQPRDPEVLADLAMVLPFAGRPAEALVFIQQAMERNPDHPDWYFTASGIAYLLTDQPSLATRDLQQWSDANPRWELPYLFLAAAKGLAGDVDNAVAALTRYRMLAPNGPQTMHAIKRQWPMQPREEEIFLRGLRIAGVTGTAG